MPLPHGQRFLLPLLPQREHVIMARALNVRTIYAIKPHKTKRQELPDNIVRGLYLVVQPSCAKSWAVRYRHDGKPTKLTLGPYPRPGRGEDGGARDARHRQRGQQPDRRRGDAEAPETPAGGRRQADL